MFNPKDNKPLLYNWFKRLILHRLKQLNLPVTKWTTFDLYTSVSREQTINTEYLVLLWSSGSSSKVQLVGKLFLISVARLSLFSGLHTTSHLTSPGREGTFENQLRWAYSCSILTTVSNNFSFASSFSSSGWPAIK